MRLAGAIHARCEGMLSEAAPSRVFGSLRLWRDFQVGLAQIDHHADATDELDVQGILAFAERVLPRASDLWVQASFDY
jgi:hypothetical protein